MLFGLPAGALNDRLDRRRTMLTVSLARAALVGGLMLAAATGAARLPFLYAVGFLVGVGEAFFDTVAPAVVPAVVERSQLPRANARRYAAELTMNEFVGTSAGGALAGAARWLPFAAAPPSASAKARASPAAPRW